MVNGDKTVLLVTCNNTRRDIANEIKLQAGTFIIEQGENIKILGYILTNKLTHDKYINSIISKVNFRLYTISTIAKYMSTKTRIINTTSIVISVIRYALEYI